MPSKDPEVMRKIAQLGGASVPREKRAFYRNRKLATDAGRKGGSNVKKENRAYSRDRELAREAGRKGGIEAQKRKREKLYGIQS